jgi:hypothetical protein
LSRHGAGYRRSQEGMERPLARFLVTRLGPGMRVSVELSDDVILLQRKPSGLSVVTCQV